jgi:hypothetical protein
LKKFIQKLKNISNGIWKIIKSISILIVIVLAVGYLTGAILYFIFPLFKIPMIDPWWFMVIGIAIFMAILRSPKKGIIIQWLNKLKNKK